MRESVGWNGEFVYEAPKPMRINDFVGFISSGEERQDALAHETHEPLGVDSAHRALHDEI